MIVKKLILDNFRCYNQAEVEFDSGVNLIWGRNGQGKTNLLEALHILSLTKSMRSGGEKSWIKFGESAARLKAYVGGDGELTCELDIQLKSGEPRRMYQDSAPVRSARDWIGCMPMVFFGPQDLDIVREGPAYRRKFLDMALCQMYPRYTQSLTVYKRVLEHKRQILRHSGEKPSLLDTLPEFNLKLARSGAEVIIKRAGSVETLNKFAARHHSDISGRNERLEIVYQTHSEIIRRFPKLSEVKQAALESFLYEMIENKTKQELCTGQVLTGPHRDDLKITVDGTDAGIYASQGQARTAALACKLAERDILEDALDAKPVLLLDDVLSELDDIRRGYLLGRHEGGQCLMTDCLPERLEKLSIGKTIQIESGRVI